MKGNWYLCYSFYNPTLGHYTIRFISLQATDESTAVEEAKRVWKGQVLHTGYLVAAQGGLDQHPPMNPQVQYVRGLSV